MGQVITQEVHEQANLECYISGERKIFKVPEIANDVENNYVLFIIDWSPSMRHILSEGLNAITINLVQKYNLVGKSSFIYFSTRNIISDTPYTDQQVLPRLKTSQTNIISAIETAKKKISKIRSVSKSILIQLVFISDGEDTCHSEEEFRRLLSQIAVGFNCTHLSFTSIGIGKEFPTHVAMTLRRNFHTVNHVSQGVQIVKNVEEYEAALDWLLSELRSSVLESNIPLSTDLWSPPDTSTNSGNIVFVDRGVEEVQFVLQTEELIKTVTCRLTPTPIQAEAIQLTIRQLINVLNHLSYTELDKTELKNRAVQANALAVALYEDWTCNVRRAENLLQKIEIKRQREINYKIRCLLLAELGRMCDGSFVNTMTAHEAALRMDLQRDVSSVHKIDRKIRRHGIQREDWPVLRDAFVNNLRKHSYFQDRLRELTKEDWKECQCAITMTSPADSLLSPNFLEALQVIDNPYAFIEDLECLPPGFGVMIKYNDAMTHEPFNIRISSMVRHVELISYTKYLSDGIDSPCGRVCRLPVGDDEVEEFNATVLVLPANFANVLAPFIRQKLTSLVLTFTIQQSADFLDVNTHLGALAACAMFLVQEGNCGFRDRRLKLIKDTFNLVYRGQGDFKARQDIGEYLEFITSTPQCAAVSEKQEIMEKYGMGAKCPALAKLALFLVCCDDICLSLKFELFTSLLQETIGRIASGCSVSDLFVLENIEVAFPDISWEAMEAEIGPLVKYFAWYECKPAIEMKFEQLNASVESESRFKVDKIWRMKRNRLGSVDLAALKALGEFLFTDSDLDTSLITLFSPEKIETMAYHGLCISCSYERATTPLKNTRAVREEVVKVLSEKLIAEKREKRLTELVQIGEMRHMECVREVHLNGTCLPMSLEQIQALPDVQRLITEGKLDPDNLAKQLRYNPVTKLPSFICCITACPFYGLVRKDTGEHFKLINEADYFLKGLHKTIAKYYKTHSAKEILALAMKGVECRGGSNATNNFNRVQYYQNKLALVKDVIRVYKQQQ